MTKSALNNTSMAYHDYFVSPRPRLVLAQPGTMYILVSVYSGLETIATYAGPLEHHRT